MMDLGEEMVGLGLGTDAGMGMENGMGSGKTGVAMGDKEILRVKVLASMSGAVTTALLSESESHPLPSSSWGCTDKYSRSSC